MAQPCNNKTSCGVSWGHRRSGDSECYNSAVNYREAEEYVLSFTNYEKTPGVPYTLANYDLRRMDELLVPLGNPHLAAKTVHVAGTKGKGSTAAMVQSILKTAGYRAALYTSPHLITLRERFRVDDGMISEEQFAAIVTEIQPLIDEVNRRSVYGPLTTFEILTVIAFLYFKRQKAEYQVLEVGLGGRLDATNVVPNPEVCIITSISLDHMAALGDTVAKIAGEKAGIIKPGAVTVTAWLPDGAWQVVSDVAREKGSPRIAVREDFWEEIASGLDGQELLVKGRLAKYRVHIPLVGHHQQENAAVAVAAIEALIERGASIAGEHIVQGLAEVKWPGRFQILRRNPYLVLDGAHNRDSMEKFIWSLVRIFRLPVAQCVPVFLGDHDPLVNIRKISIVCGMSVDKDISGIVQGMFGPLYANRFATGGYIEWECADSIRFILTRADHPRAADPYRVMDKHIPEVEKKRVRIIDRVEDAISQALAEAAPDGLVAVTGSLFVVGEALAWAEKHPEALK